MGKERLVGRKDPYVITVGVVMRARQGGVSIKRIPSSAAAREPIAVEISN